MDPRTALSLGSKHSNDMVDNIAKLQKALSMYKKSVMTQRHLLNYLSTVDFRSEEHTSEPSHTVISYAVFCLKKKKKKTQTHTNQTKDTHQQQNI